MTDEIAPREQCPKCAQEGHEGTNLAIYADGGKFCHRCAYTENKGTEKKSTYSDLIPGTVVELVDRCLPLEMAEKYRIHSTEYTGSLGKGIWVTNELVRIFPVFYKGKVVQQKIKAVRLFDGKKKQKFVGNTEFKGLFGQHLFPASDKVPLIITEGEEDAAAAHYMTGLPAVGIMNGATGSEQALINHMGWLNGFKYVYFCMDNDEKGSEAVQQYLYCDKPIFEPGKVRQVRLPLKDANDMLKARRIEEFKQCLYAAEIVKPSTIIFPSEIRAKVLEQPKFGSPWPWPFMTKVTYGMRLGETYMLAADSSIGKTEIVYHIVRQHIADGGKVGLIDLERQPEQTIQRLISGLLVKKLYLPDCKDFDKDEINAEIDKIDDRIALYRPASGRLTLNSILVNIRYLAKAYNMTFFVIDNLTALSTNMRQSMKEHEFASYATGQLVQLSKELNVTIFIINHLTKAPVQLNADITMPEEFKYETNKEGLTWETGRMPEMGHVYGGGKVCKLPDYVMVATRNRMSHNDLEKRTIQVKFLKTRFESQYEGAVFKLVYDRKTGRLNEAGRQDEPEVEESDNLLVSPPYSSILLTTETS